MDRPLVRFTVRGLMVVVATVAVLTPFPGGAALAVAETSLVWTPFLLIGLAIAKVTRPAPARGPRSSAARAPRKTGLRDAIIFTIVIGAVSLFLPALPAWDSAFSLVVLILTPPNLIGPVHGVWQIYRPTTLTAGEILWARLGLVWWTLLVSWHPHSGAEIVSRMADYARLSLVLALLLMLYGPRPASQRPAWGHHAGWALMECDVVVWGWYAAGFLG
jgi:hypothetical protein